MVWPYLVAVFLLLTPLLVWRARADYERYGRLSWFGFGVLVAWFLFLLGFAVMWWTWRCWIALAMLVAALHTLVLVEEEHLRRVFGDAYRDFCECVPRWLGRPGRRAT